MEQRTVFGMLEATAARYGGSVGLHQPCDGEGGGRYRRYTWAEFRDASREIAAALATLGIRKGDVAAIASETRAELYLADFGIMALGTVAAALYTAYHAGDLVRTLRLCGAKLVFAEDPKMLKRLQAAADSPLAVHWVLLAGREQGVMSLDELRQLGRDAMERDPDLWPRLRQDVRSEDPAILYLTSGATGEPKMALLSHGALVANASIGPEVLGATPRDSTIAFLPSAHIIQRLVMELLMVYCGVPVWFSVSLLRLPQELVSIEPTLFVGPPRLWERIYKTVTTEIGKRPAPVRKLAQAALGLGLRITDLELAGRPVPLRMKIARGVADRMVYRKIRQRFGRRLRFAASGAAPLGADLARFYMAIGLPLHEGFGLTEGGIVILNPTGRQKPGSIGKPLPGVEVRLAEDGELEIKCAYMFMRYFEDPEATASVMDGEWLRTGDICEQDDEGYLFITGRKKEVVVTSAGRKIYPALVENLFKTEPLINHVLLLGDKLPYPVALVTVNTAAALALKGMEGYKDRPPSEVVKAPLVGEEVERAVSRVNRRLAEFDRIHRFRILERDFTIEDGELTATLKLRRARILANHSALIDELYSITKSPNHQITKSP